MGVPAEQLEVEEEVVVVVVVALAVVGMHLNVNGEQPAACLRWPVVRAERLGRRYETTIVHHPMMPVPQGMRMSHQSLSERKLTCGLAFSSSVTGADRTLVVDVLHANLDVSTSLIPKHIKTISSRKSRICDKTMPACRTTIVR